MIAEKVLTSPRLVPSKRFTLALLVSLALFTHYAQRISLAMGIVCMVDRTNTNLPSNITLSSTSINKKTIQESQHKYGSELLQDRKFAFSEFQQQILLGAHWLGYTITLVPGT